MPQLRQTVHVLLASVQELLESLLFDWSPDVCLEGIQDDIANSRPGYSFLAEPANNLRSSFRVLSKGAFSQQGKLSLEGRGRVRAVEYLVRRDRLVRRLFAAIHMTSGMPARGEELRMLR